MSGCVLIITNREDIHADIVGEKIVARGGSFFRLNIEEFPKDYRLTYRIIAGRCDGEIVHHPSGERVSLACVGATWLRRLGKFSFASALGAQEFAFARQEAEQALLGLICSLDCYWMSHPAATRQAKWKGEQLKRATQMGFSIPQTIISNNRRDVEAFRADMDRDIAFKTLSSPFLGADQVLAEDRMSLGIQTTRIGEGHDELFDAIYELPCFFQKYVAKAYEVRTTIIGRKVFSARINSQDDPRTATDFRDYSADIKYEIEELPREIEERCLAFVRSYGLNYGAIDLIVTPAKEFVFLENNPGGQFLFVEQLVPQLQMTDALANCLIEEAGARMRCRDALAH